MVRDRNLSGSTSAEGAPLYGADESVSTLYSLRACWGDAVCEEWRGADSEIHFERGARAACTHDTGEGPASRTRTFLPGKPRESLINPMETASTL